MLVLCYLRLYTQEFIKLHNRGFSTDRRYNQEHISNCAEFKACQHRSYLHSKLDYWLISPRKFKLPVWFVFLAISRIVQNLTHRFPWNLVAGWRIGDLERIRVTGRIHDFRFSFTDMPSILKRTTQPWSLTVTKHNRCRNTTTPLETHPDM